MRAVERGARPTGVRLLPSPFWHTVAPCVLAAMGLARAGAATLVSAADLTREIA